VMQKVGMHCTGVIPGKYEKDGQIYDAVCYAVTKEDWIKR